MKFSIKNLRSVCNASAAILTAGLAFSLSLTACLDDEAASTSAGDSSAKGSMVSSIVAYLPGSNSKSLKKSAATIDANNMHTVATVYEDDTQGNQIKVSWEENDGFNVSNGSTKVMFVSHGIDEETGEATEFKPENKNDKIECSDNKPCTAVYPY